MGYDWPPKRKLQARPFPKRPASKMKNIRTNGMDSMLEAAVYQILKLREKAGEINNILAKRRVHLGTESVLNLYTKKRRIRQMYWKVDFSFYDVALKRMVWCEAKGMESPLYRRQLRMWREGGPGRLEVWKGHWKAPYLALVVVPPGL